VPGSAHTDPAAPPGRTPRTDPAGRVGRAYGSEGSRRAQSALNDTASPGHPRAAPRRWRLPTCPCVGPGRPPWARADLSRWRHGFESRWGCHTRDQVGGPGKSRGLSHPQAEEIDHRLALFLKLAIVTRARRGAYCTLRWDHLDLAPARFTRVIVIGPDGTHYPDGRLRTSVPIDRPASRTKRSGRKVALAPYVVAALLAHHVRQVERATAADLCARCIRVL
jgi:hypothetical protein